MSRKRHGETATPKADAQRKRRDPPEPVHRRFLAWAQDRAAGRPRPEHLPPGLERLERALGVGPGGCLTLRVRSIEMPAGWAGRRKDVLLALSIVNVTALVWLATLPASTWLYGGLCVLQIGLAASWPKSVRSPDLPVEIRGHGLTIHDGHGTAVAVPWSRVSSVARPGPHLCGDIAIDLNPVITGLPSRILVHGYTRDAERLLAAWELIESWRAAGLSVPGIVVDVPDSALSLARLTNDVPGDRGLSVADDPESQSTVASRSA